MERRVGTTVDEITKLIIEFYANKYNSSTSEYVRNAIAYYTSKLIKNSNEKTIKEMISYVISKINADKLEKESIKQVLKEIIKDDKKIKEFIKYAPLIDEVITGVILEELDRGE